jgi:hypothetical protein
MRIAVVFSGEARTFNTHTAEYWVRWKEAVESESDIELCFYGHTWDHCPEEEIPNTNILPLKNIWIESKSIITDWICKDFSSRHYKNYKDKRYGEIDPNDDKTKIEFIDDVLSYSVSRWGQFISTWCSFSRIPKEEYQNFDGFIKVRWDCYIRPEENANHKLISKHMIKKTNAMRQFFIEHRNRKAYATSIHPNPKRLEITMARVVTVMPNDIMYYITKSGMDAFIDNASVEDFMRQTILTLNLEAPSTASHTFFTGMMSIKKLDLYIMENDTILDLFRAKISRKGN